MIESEEITAGAIRQSMEGAMGKCLWEMLNNEWQTDCGNAIYDKETSCLWKFCPWCGKQIKEHAEGK